MSDTELQIEEESLQLTPEDIQLLSEYSWDMTGYTSRFGYFYLGSEKENVQGLTKWQAENIYQLTPTPPGMEDALQNMEKSKRINKEKKKRFYKEMTLLRMHILPGQYRKRIFCISAFSSTAMSISSTEMFIRLSEGTAWIPMIQPCFWI